MTALELRECLARSSQESLGRIAAQLGVDAARDPSQVTAAITEVLTDPVRLRVILTDLSDEAWSALKVVYYNGGPQGITVELCHQIVNLLSGRRRKSSARALEELQNHGLIYTRTASYRQLYFLPLDLLERLAPMLNQELLDRVALPQQAEVRVVPLERNLLEDLHRFLSYLYKHEVTLTQQGLIYKRHLRALLDLLHSGESEESLVGRYPEPLGLLVGYALDRRLAMRAGGVLGVTDELFTWLEQPSHMKQEDLFHYWRDRYYYQDLQTVLQVLESLGTRWVSLTALVGELEPRINPSQRGSFLVRLRHHLTTFLGPLGLFELGDTPDETDGVCRLTPVGYATLTGKPLEPAELPAQAPFFLQATFEIIAPRPVQDQVIWMLELMGDLEGRTDRTLTYRLSRPSVYRALQRGLTGHELIAFLERYAATEVPQNVRFEINAWAESYGQVYLQAVTLLRCASPDLAEQVKASRRTGRFVLGELTPTDLIVDSAQYQSLLEALIQDGLMPRPGVEGQPKAILSPGGAP